MIKKYKNNLIVFELMMEQLARAFQEASDALKKNITHLCDSNSFLEENKFSFQDMIDERDQDKKNFINGYQSYDLAYDQFRNGYFEHFNDNLIYDESFDLKITNLKMNSVSSRRKDQLFKRYKKEQEEKINQRKRQLEIKFPYQNEMFRSSGQFFLNNQPFTLKNEDLEKLRPDTDLNDTILDNYIKLLRLKILPSEVEQKTFIYSSFFLGKILGDLLREQPPTEKETQQLTQKMAKKVEQNYSAVRRWTRKIDIFDKEFLVIPINAYKHWNCIIVVAPNALVEDSELCRIIYLDSFFEKRNLFTEAIKMYLRIELRQKRGIEKQLIMNIPSYQLLVPRQTNTHDCGLYTLCYIQYFLLSSNLLESNMEQIGNREQLKIFPRSIILTMRECLRRLFSGLAINEDKEKVLREYLDTRKRIFLEATQQDYDSISEREFQKYYRINLHLLDDKNRSEEEMEYLCKIKFYLDSEINHYEKDKY